MTFTQSSSWSTCLLCLLTIAVVGTSQLAGAFPFGIRDEIERQLKSLNDIGKHDLNVEVRGTTVKVMGSVASESDRNKVIGLIHEVSGVSKVVDLLKVREIETKAPPSSLILKLRLEIKAALPNAGYSLEITERGSTLIIDGKAYSAPVKEQILSVVSRAAPERQVIDNILVSDTPVATDSEITQRVLNALKGESAVSGVTIETRDGIVHFKGQVANHREIDRLLSLTLMVEGVRSIRSDVKYTR